MPDAVSLGDALKKFLETSKFKNEIQSLKIEERWEKMMGPAIAGMTSKIEIRNHTLFIHTSIAALRNELVFQRDLIKKRINEELGQELVREIVIS